MKYEDGQLRDVVITIASVSEDDRGEPYAVTSVYRYELETRTKDDLNTFVRYIEEYSSIVEGGQMNNQFKLKT